MNIRELAISNKLSGIKLGAIAEHLGLPIEEELTPQESDQILAVSRQIQGKATPAKIEAAIAALTNPGPTSQSSNPAPTPDLTADAINDQVADLAQVVNGGGVMALREQGRAALAPVVHQVAQGILDDLRFQVAGEVMLGLFGGTAASPTGLFGELNALADQMKIENARILAERRAMMALPTVATPAGYL